ncbi:MFS transporter [Chitinophaga sp. MM2321]|uniref:MFS transporter n=1 Tax=Chitinophaga sp. MM2321 TaxID=3137178 RepID=UPI0032D5B0CC
MNKHKMVFAGACVGMLLFGIGLITLGAVVPELKEKFQLNDMAAGAMFSILPLGILTGSLVFGPCCDLYGYKLMLVLSGILMFIGFEGIAYAPTLLLLKVCIYLFGLGSGAINGATNAVVADISSKDKGADLSLLGVFFGIGALGMPVVLGVLENRFPVQSIVAGVGGLALAAALLFALIRFPPPKQAQGFPIVRSLQLINDKVLLLIAFFLFCQSSFEAIINNWTTTYLMKRLSVAPGEALYALSLYVAGMTVMRLLTGSIFRTVSIKKILFASFIMLFCGSVLLAMAHSFVLAAAGLILLGAGLAGGFPVMLGIVGHRYTDLSATAFSFVLVIALLGNTLVNYSMGVIIQHYGIQQLTNVALGEVTIMFLLSLLILKKK